MHNESDIVTIDTEGPEYYGELLRLRKTARVGNRRQPDERYCSNVPGIQNLDDPLAQRLQTLLDVVADISLTQRGNVSATMASLTNDKGTLLTQLYIAFNHQDNGAVLSCPQHLQSIFTMLREVPYKPPAIDGSPKSIAKEFQSNLIEICSAIHNYSFDIFAYRVTKRQHRFSDIRRYIEQDRTHFTPEDRSTLAAFLRHVEAISKAVADAEATKQIPIIDIRMLINMYSHWTKNNLLPKEGLAHHQDTLLDDADKWLAGSAWSDT